MVFAMAATVLLIIALMIVATGAGEAVIDEVQDLAGYGGPHSDDMTGSRTLFHAGVPIAGVKAGETYGAYDERRNKVSNDEYLGFACADGCRAHKGGYRWAAANRISRPRECVGPTWAFVEGCAAYVLRRR